MVRTYRKYVAENRSLVYVSTLLAVLLRTGFLFATEYPLEDSNDRALAVHIPFLFESRYVLFACSLALTVVIALQLTYLNYRYTLIRGKTSLPYVFALLLLSVLPDYIYRISPYIGVIVILLAIHILFSSYHQVRASQQAFNVGFTLGIASLVLPGLLWYLILFWIGFSMMRSFSFKAFLASLFAIGMVYWLKLSYLVYTQGSGNFSGKLTQGWDNFYETGILPVEKTEIDVLAAIYVFALLIVLINSYMNKFDDKIQVRTNFSFLNRLLSFSIALYLFLLYYMPMNLIITLVISGFILSHFFALADRKWKVYFFILLAVLYFANYAWTITALLGLV